MRASTLRRWFTAMALGSIPALWALGAAAAVPSTLTHQGRLYDQNDAPVVGTLPVVFAIYDTPGAAVPLWSEVQQVTFDEGYYSVSLGSVAPFGASVLDGSTRYFGLTVGAAYDSCDIVVRAN